MSEELRQFLLSRGVATSRTTPYNPACNGQVERYNGTIWKTIMMALKTRDYLLHTGKMCSPMLFTPYDLCYAQLLTTRRMNDSSDLRGGLPLEDLFRPGCPHLVLSSSSVTFVLAKLTPWWMRFSCYRPTHSMLTYDMLMGGRPRCLFVI